MKTKPKATTLSKAEQAAIDARKRARGEDPDLAPPLPWRMTAPHPSVPGRCWLCEVPGGMLVLQEGAGLAFVPKPQASDTKSKRGK